ncbi:hypothetical protein [Falsiroseomonas oryzae]|uniref:hypothetical protein n=1 Tax=Falsiroseomonas oryzae TaxID=2766473 RepID=UPI0022EB7348|nr:hypothetical protein [Roseomonas sp. MO-31]
MTRLALAWAAAGWYPVTMESSTIDDTPKRETGPEASPTTARAEAYRERFRQAQLIAAQVARVRAAGGPPGEDETARLIAEFHARGGKVTVCPEPEQQEAADQNQPRAKRSATR